MQRVLDDGGRLGYEHPITASELKRRGWTETMIKRFLHPVQRVTNPHYTSAQKMRVFALGDVAAVELTEPYKIARDKADKASSAAMLVVAAKNAEAARVATELHIDFPDVAGIREIAKRELSDDSQLPFGDVPQRVVDRKALMLVMDELRSAYWALDELYGRKGAVMARKVLDERVAEWMRNACPDLLMLMHGIGASFFVINEVCRNQASETMTKFLLGELEYAR